MEQQNEPATDPTRVLRMLEACYNNNRVEIELFLTENPLYACQQDETTGTSPLMAAAQGGHAELCTYLLEKGAPWNAVDRQGQCAGNYATTHEHWDVVNLLVDAGTRAELILGASIRLQRYTMKTNGNHSEQHEALNDNGPNIPVEHEPCTKPDYLRQRLTYNKDGTALLDSDKDAVMMEWERPLMKAHASILMDTPQKRVLNVGFGMGIIDSALQELNPSLHIIIEAHPDVYKQMIDQKWNEKPNVRICFGKWQDVLPQLIKEGLQVDGIFYDTYGEHFLDLEDFHDQMIHLLSKPHGIYSFFNGLAPDNIFFHGVACQCVKLQLGELGLNADFLPCEIQVKDSEWEGIRRKYWHGRDTYYLPRVTWKPEVIQQKQQAVSKSTNNDKKKAAEPLQDEDMVDAKRQKIES